MVRFQYLVAVDGSSRSEDAVEHAARFTEIYGAELTAIHVVDSSVYKDPNIIEGMETAGERYLEKVEEIAKEHGANLLEAKVVVGSPFEEILDEASRIDASVIFMGATGVSHSAHIGTIASRVLRGAECHLMLVRGGAEGYENVLIATDGSKDAEYAAQSGLSIARRFNAKASVCYVADRVDIDETRVVTAGGVGAGRRYGDVLKLPKSAVKKLREHMLDESTKIAERVRKIADSKGVEAEIIVREGKPAPEILKIVREECNDLVVIGSAGKGTISKLLVGSVSEKVASTAPCSVIIVRGTRMERVVPVDED